MSDEFLDGLVREEWSGWRKRAYRQSNPPALHLVETVDGEVVGYSDVGSSQRDDAEGQLYAIYLSPYRIGEGLGRSLITAARKALVGLGHRSADLWVLKSNDRARGFYEADGWVADGAEKAEEFGGGLVEEVRYVRDLESYGI